MEQALATFYEIMPSERDGAAAITEPMEVFGSDGARIGMAVRGDDGKLQLWERAPASAGQHHYLPADMVASVAGRITLAIPAAEAVAATGEVP